MLIQSMQSRLNTMYYDEHLNTLTCNCGVGLSLRLSHSPMNPTPTPTNTIHHTNHHNHSLGIMQDRIGEHNITILTIFQLKQMLSEVYDRHVMNCFQIQQHFDGTEINNNSNNHHSGQNYLQYQIDATGQQLIALCPMCCFYERLL